MDGLLDSGRVSGVTYEQLNKEFMKIIGKMRDLKDTLRHEEDFWRSNLDEMLGIMEIILTSGELRYISGDIDAAEWERMKTILTLGLDSVKAMMNHDAKLATEPDLPNLASNQKTEQAQLDAADTSLVTESHIEATPSVVNTSEEVRDASLESVKKNRARLHVREKAKKRSVKNKTDAQEAVTSGAHCRNPWNAKCKNTNIELSIYYKGESLPICRRCWQEISDKNLEW